MGHRPKPKYQVFISSTYTDLKDDREAVTWEVLKANHIPVGMENFPATDDRGWKTITRAIDRSDYYVLLVAGMYGTVDAETGKSWTQLEYEYARAKGVPVLAFIRDEVSTTANFVEKAPEKVVALNNFKAMLKDAHLLETWQYQADLGGRVVHALRNQIEVDEEGESPRPGWYRGSEIPAGAAMEEFARLSAENADLRERLGKLEQREEKLVLLRADSSAIEDSSYTVPRHVLVERTSDGNPYFGAGSALARLDDPSSEDVEAYLDDLSSVHWLRLRLRNDGGKPARNVVATFSCKDAVGVVVHELEEPDGPLALRRPTPFYYRPGEPVYVSAESDDPPVSIEQRVQLVGVGGAEQFIAMGFRAPRGRSSFQFTIVYEIRSEDGASAKGSFVESVVVGPAVKTVKRSEVGLRD